MSLQRRFHAVSNSALKFNLECLAFVAASSSWWKMAAADRVAEVRLALSPLCAPGWPPTVVTRPPLSPTCLIIGVHTTPIETASLSQPAERGPGSSVEMTALKLAVDLRWEHTLHLAQERNTTLLLCHSQSVLQAGTEREPVRGERKRPQETNLSLYVTSEKKNPLFLSCE